MVNQVRIAVIGGGAAGFFGAIAAKGGAIASTEARRQTQVTLLEAGPQSLTKVLISGGGRCNVTHACFDPALLIQNYPRGGKALRGPFSRFQPRDTVAWFQQQGVQLKTEPDGRMFPVTDDAATIADCLIQVARKVGVDQRTRVPVVAIEAKEGGFRLQLKSGEVLGCDRVLLATGSNPQGYRFARALGHTILPPVPSLFTFNIADSALHQLAGVSVETVQTQLLLPEQKPLKQSGPLLITHWGVSGPAILKLSAWGARLLHDHRYQATLQINWVPHLNPEALRQLLTATRTESPKRAIATHCPVNLPRRLWQYLVNRASIAPQQNWAELSKKSLNQLLQELSQGCYLVQGKGVFKDEFVTCGGVSLDEVNFKTMESRICPGLYFAGEILDIDGVTGGFNFQSAWTTGWIAGQAISG